MTDPTARRTRPRPDLSWLDPSGPRRPAADPRDPEPDPGALAAARAARLDRPPGWAPTIAVTPGVDPAPLRAAGWSLRGTVTDDPFGVEGQPLSPREACEHAGLDAVAVDGTDPAAAALVPALREAGLLLLLPTPDPLDPEAVRAARAVRDGPDAAVGLHERWSSWARAVAAALPLDRTRASR